MWSVCELLIYYKLRSKVESDGGDAFSSAMISDFLYGHLDGSQIEEAMDEIKHYNVLKTWSSKQWSDIIDKCVYSVRSSLCPGCN